MSEAPFCGLRLLVEPGKVMTPRPTTESLVEAAVQRIAGRAALVADVGTGSGAVALAIASRAPEARIWATDTSASAVRLARANVCRHGLGDRVSVVHGDLLDGSPAGLDLVVANLPYLAIGPQADRPELAEEPPEAVFAAGDGLGPYRRLVQACESALQPDGFLAIQFHGQVVGTHASELGALTLAA